MNGNIGMRALSALFAVLLVSVGVVPAMACEPGTPCSDVKQGMQKTDLSGLEKYEAVAFALNLDDVKKLSDISRSEDFGLIVDNAQAFSFEKKLEDGSINHITAVVLPIESIVEKDGSVQTSNVAAIWDSDTNRVLKSTYIFQNKSLYKLTFSIIDANGDVLEEVIVDEGSFVERMPGQLFATAEDPSYWECIAACVAIDCACALAGIPCPGLPICDFCVTLLPACVYVPTVITCGAVVACFGLEATSCMVSCL
ncbi:MAG: Uncharacterized protein XE11_2466 [Methanomicrobiales archaeon 53_19]|nr:MAG: Uncharacterized protein XD88_1923 [Methanocalculus sp. 52_23]KUL00406.1 MAG: Uncharacterized protein XE11_2466 [Methanomicrobiales archaeon 53_19]